MHRKILEWEWYSDLPVRCLFEHCLLKANWKDKKFKGRVVKRGTFLTGREALARESGLSVQQVRRALANLEATNEIATKKTPQGTEIKVINYDQYQAITSKTTSEQPTNNQQTTTTNKDNKDNNKDIYAKRLSEFALPDEWAEKARTYWLSKNRTDLDPQTEYTKFQDNHIAKGTKSLDWSRNWRTWYTNAITFTKQQGGARETHRQNRISTIEAAAEHNERFYRELEQRASRKSPDDHDEALASIDPRARQCV